MKVFLSNFNQNYSLNSNKIQNNNTANSSFKGNENNVQLPTGGYYSSAQLHPAFALQLQLINDGYAMEEIKKSQIFSYIDFASPNFRTGKKMEDVYALQKGYSLLKEKFNSPEVKEHIAKTNALENEINAFLEKRGHKKHTNGTTLQSMILQVLHNVDNKNVDLLEELLNDENFNNAHLSTALMKLDKSKSSKYGLETLKMAQNFGYDKEFSYALSVLISEADQYNLPIIEKMLSEQEFLSENSDFVSSKLMSFLRGKHPNLIVEYLTNDTLTLNEINELLDYQYED